MHGIAVSLLLDRDRIHLNTRTSDNTRRETPLCAEQASLYALLRAAVRRRICARFPIPTRARLFHNSLSHLALETPFLLLQAGT